MSDCLLIIQLSSLMTMWENIKKMGFLILTGALSGVKNKILRQAPCLKNIWRFLLLNEVVEPDSTRWNKLMLECVKAIREIDSTRWLYIGGNNYNSPDELKNLADIDDDYIVYNFHFYNPFFFTHQKAHWSESAMAYNRTVKYPGQYEGIEEFVKNNPKYSFMMELNNLKLNKELLRKDLKILRGVWRNCHC